MLQNLSSAAVVIGALRVNSFPASGDFCRLLLIIANSLDPDQVQHTLDPDQAQHFVGPDLDPNCLTVKR